MLIKFKYYGVPIGLEENELEAELDEDGTVEALIKALMGDAGEKSELLKNASYMVNNAGAGLQTALRDGDEVIVMRVLGGG